jgi:beta-glucosidase
VAPPVWTAEQAQREMKQAVDLAASSDLTVLVLGESQDVSGEAASRDSLELPGEQQQLIERVVGLGKPVAFLSRDKPQLWSARLR